MTGATTGSVKLTKLTTTSKTTSLIAWLTAAGHINSRALELMAGSAGYLLKTLIYFSDKHLRSASCK
jgi:hypothetical protein